MGRARGTPVETDVSFKEQFSDRTAKWAGAGPAPGKA
jgi:hypothetical protein